MAVFEFDEKFYSVFRHFPSLNPEKDFSSYCEKIPGRLERLAWSGIDKHWLIFFDLMRRRRVQPDLYVPDDLAMLAANVIYDIKPQGIALMDRMLLPAAVLLAGKGIPVRLPEDAQGLAPLFSAPLGECISLGWDLGKHLREKPDFIDQLRDGSVFLSPRDFLTSQRDESARQRLLEAKKLSTVMRLSKAGRDSWGIYSALLLIGNNSEEIRLPRTRSTPYIQRHYIQTQDGMLACLHDEAAPRILVEEALRKKKITSPEDETTGESLRKFAEVIRCQLPRNKTDDSEAPRDSDIAVANEYSLSDLDRVTGFLDPDGGSLSEVSLKKAGDKSLQSFLKKHDILMVFRGAEQSIGKVGFCLELPEDRPSIPNRAFCIIRAKHGVDPINLYYALRKSDVVETLQAAASGQKSLIISLETIRDLPIKMPAKAVQVDIKDEHIDIKRAWYRIKREFETITTGLEAIEKLGGE